MRAKEYSITLIIALSRANPGGQGSATAQKDRATFTEVFTTDLMSPTNMLMGSDRLR